jgi:hypothetical protein
VNDVTDKKMSQVANNISDNSIKWVARLERVHDVTLLGSADLAYWRRRLESEELAPANFDGRARITVAVVRSRYMFVPFREISFSVLVEPFDDRCGEQSAFLIQAFNSCRFFAFCERRFFSTPYLHADVNMQAQIPVSVELRIKDGTIFHARMASHDSPSPVDARMGGWEGIVHLPTLGASRPRRLFKARISGSTQSIPFLPGRDSLTMKHSAFTALPQRLQDSGFSPELWEIRQAATHMKSVTYTRQRVQS